MKHLLILIFLSGGIMGFSQKMKPIFNGKNLKGWEEPEDNVWWSVENGVLVGKNAGEQGSIMWTEKEYKDFIVEADFKFISGDIDSGIFLREISQQIQLGVSASLRRDLTGSPYISGKGYPAEAKNVEKSLRQDDWNTIKVKVVGEKYTVWLNGNLVLEYTSEKVPEKGKIGVQVHSKNDMEIHFKNLKAANL